MLPVPLSAECKLHRATEAADAFLTYLQELPAGVAPLASAEPLACALPRPPLTLAHFAEAVVKNGLAVSAVHFFDTNNVLVPSAEERWGLSGDDAKVPRSKWDTA